MELHQARPLLLSDGRTGSTNQALGVAAALGFTNPEVITLHKTWPQPWLGWLPVGLLYHNWPEVQAAARGADLALAAGHGPSRVLRALKRQNPKLFTVALMRPSGQARDYNVVAVPEHDGYPSAPNVIATLGNPNLITRERLANEGQRWAKRLSHLHGFKLAVLVGGPSKHGGLSVAETNTMMASLIKALKTQFTEGASLLISTSRRTPEAARHAIEQQLLASGLPHMLWHPDTPTARDNPYFAYLHHANAVVVTADSSSMVSEACTSGKPVYLWGTPKATPSKFAKLYAALAHQGRLKWWDGQLSLRAPAAPLLATTMVAGFIRALWQKHWR